MSTTIAMVPVGDEFVDIVVPEGHALSVKKTLITNKSPHTRPVRLVKGSQTDLYDHFFLYPSEDFVVISATNPNSTSQKTTRIIFNKGEYLEKTVIDPATESIEIIINTVCDYILIVKKKK